MSAKEFTEWQALYLYVEPFGGKFLDMQFASLRLQNYGGEDRSKRSLEDFMLYDYSMMTPEQKEQEALSIVKLRSEAQAAALKDFFLSKVHKQNNHN